MSAASAAPAKITTDDAAPSSNVFIVATQEEIGGKSNFDASTRACLLYLRNN
jgi:hypothetical protein